MKGNKNEEFLKQGSGKEKEEKKETQKRNWVKIGIKEMWKKGRKMNWGKKNERRKEKRGKVAEERWEEV